MTLRLTPRTLEAAYDYLRSTPPFDRWSMPPGGDVKFKVGRTRHKFGWYQWDGSRHTITASSGTIGYSGTLLSLIAHEMIHLHLEATGQENRTGDTSHHNAAFKRYAAQVCRLHGFDPKAFC
jgi:hypothetical protein